MGAIVTNPDNIGYFNPPNVYRPAIIDISIVGEYSSEDGATNTYRITQNDGKIFEFDVKNGSGGSAGRSVTSVEQIQVSTESLGKNVARITLSDGTYTDVEIRNGAQGETGPQGLRGPAGIDSVEASIGTNDPTQAPSVDKDLTEGVLSLTFNNIKGAKGDQGEPAVAVENYVTVEATSSTTSATDVLPTTGSADTVYRVSNWDGTQYDANAYTEYGWYDGAYKMLATRTPGIDDEPTAGSQKLVKSGGVAAQISQLGQYVDNPEWIKIVTDSEDKILEGIKADGTKVVGGNIEVGGDTYIHGDAKILGNMEVSGVSYKVVENPEYLAAWIDGENKVIFGIKSDGKTYVGDADFLNDIEDIKAFLANITDKNIDWDALSSITAVDNPEYIEAKTDSEGKLLAGRTPDGVAFENVGFSTPKVFIDGHIIENIEDLEGRTEIKTDAEGNILSYRDNKGVIHEEVGIENNSNPFDILSLYPKKKMLPILVNLKFGRHQSYNLWNNFDEERVPKPPYYPLTLIHFSDIHEDYNNLSRIVKFFNEYHDYIDDVVFTGDVVLNVFNVSKFNSFWKGCNADDILFVVGNHDACSALSPYTPVSPKEEYDTYLKPFLSHTNINVEENKCYWYKDYHEAKSPECPNGIRLIALDQYHWYERTVIGDYVNPIYQDGTTVDTGQQQTWLRGLLNDALENGYAIITALHSPTNASIIPEQEDGIHSMGVDGIDCTFDCLDKLDTAPYSRIPIAMLNDIQDFIDAGGEFICWMAGHEHQDWFAVIKDYPNQIIMLADTGSSSMMDRGNNLIFNTNYMDKFNLFSVDPFKKFIRLHRIGMTFDRHLRHVEDLVYDYKNKKVIYNS